MPVDTVFSLIGKAKDILMFILDRLDQMKLSDSIVMTIKENLEYLQLTIEKIAPYLKKDSDTKEIKQFLTHLENASQSCTEILEKNAVKKFATVPAIMLKIRFLEAEIKAANSKLLLFIDANHLTMFCESTDFIAEKITKMAILQENSTAGIYELPSNFKFNSVKQSEISAPLGFTIQESKSKNRLMLSWQPCKETVDQYEVKYEENEKSIISVRKSCTSLELGSPRVRPGKVYLMKVRGIKEGVKGKWSDVAVGQFTKPLPQKPQISNLLLRSTMTVVTIKLPEAICSTESPVTCVEISYVSTTSSKLSSCKFNFEPENDTHVFTVIELKPDTTYNFTVKTKNAEGWSKPSDLREGVTLSLPPKPNKPDPPNIKACSSTKVNLEAQVPENTCSIKSPIIEWKVCGYSSDRKQVNRHYNIDQMENLLMEKSHIFGVSDLNPNQQYTLQLVAKNENGWSEPSEEFKIHIAKPSTPKNTRPSSKRSHSLLKIRWNAPDCCLITHYEIIKRTRKGNYDEKPYTVPADKFSATFKKLKQNTHYCFKVRACNDTNVSNWSKEIEINTRIHQGIKAALSPVVWAVGTVTAPVLMPLGAGGAAGMAGHDKYGKKGAVAAATAGTVGGVVLGTVGAPVVGATWTHLFMHGMDGESDQSDDEDAVIIEC